MGNGSRPTDLHHVVSPAANMLAFTVLLLAVLQTVSGQSCNLGVDSTTVYRQDNCNFYRCENGSPVNYRCAYDTSFSDTLKRCVYSPSTPSFCGNANGVPSNPGCQQCGVGRDMFLPSWDICRSSSFYVCRNGQRYRGSCPSGYSYYNSVLGACSNRPDSLSLCTFNITSATTGRTALMSNPRLLLAFPIWGRLPASATSR